MHQAFAYKQSTCEQGGVEKHSIRNLSALPSRSFLAYLSN